MVIVIGKADKDASFYYGFLEAVPFGKFSIDENFSTEGRNFAAGVEDGIDVLASAVYVRRLETHLIDLSRMNVLAECLADEQTVRPPPTAIIAEVID